MRIAPGRNIFGSAFREYLDSHPDPARPLGLTVNSMIGHALGRLLEYPFKTVAAVVLPQVRGERIRDQLGSRRP